MELIFGKYLKNGNFDIFWPSTLKTEFIPTNFNSSICVYGVFYLKILRRIKGGGVLTVIKKRMVLSGIKNHSSKLKLAVSNDSHI